MPDTNDNARHDDLLSLRHEVVDRSVVVHAAGEVDHDTAPRLARELVAAGQEASPARPLVLDMTGISFIASAALAVLIEHHKRLREAGHELRVVTGNPKVARALDRTGLLQLLSAYDTLEKALADGSRAPE